MSLFYQFPKIETIDDVLPSIKSREEFIVVDKDDFIVINYAVSTDTTFDMKDEYDLDGAIRRECRGIKFYPDGRIMARPFHKFFNSGEREETQPQNVDFSIAHHILTKMDGSMIHPIVMKDGSIRFATKMGITDVSLQAEVFINQHSKYEQFAKHCMIDMKWTPIFEWTSPDNRIVLHYENPSLTLLAIRETVSGEYINLHVLSEPE